MLADQYGLTRSKLSELLNVQFYDELSAVGYKKHHRLLYPIVVLKFKEIYGEPTEE